VAVVQYTFTNKQHTERQKEIHRTTQKCNWEEYRPCPVLASYTLAFTTEEKARKNLKSTEV
jgi:hypothetical protein